MKGKTPSLQLDVLNGYEGNTQAVKTTMGYFKLKEKNL